MKCMCGSCWPTYPNFFNPTLNFKMVFGEKIPKMGTFQILSLFSLLNVITKFINFPTYSKFCWYATGTTHIFHFGLSCRQQNFMTSFLLCRKEKGCLTFHVCHFRANNSHDYQALLDLKSSNNMENFCCKL